ncbi:RNA-directed DNA polymerase [Sulfurimonas sediminis]|uniref:RNA-directed DNA polymerase n=1 Tax=Sulfurimonas sediminis TaxID=2590020 RepID=A0A7M1B655_9BACT|nr:RNA-directed DNA polymerase [Sulfurimonas sediminis]QOP44192.1 RNA-directed DNA polymerase [Sulfurimonas sediminis]
MPKDILSLNFQEAKDFLLKQESYITTNLPKYFEFNNLLLELSKELKQEKFIKFANPNENPKNYEDINYKLLTNKNGKHDWRPIQLIHPVIYVSLVNQITKEENWKKIKDRFLQIKKRSIVECMSLPIVSETKQSSKKEQILFWWENIEQKSLELSLEFSSIYHTDISDCYGSIYTHSIPWAIHSKNNIKYNWTKKSKKYFIGNDIDIHIQAMSNSQTNGIPQGSILMDFIAEIVLSYADLLLSVKLKNKYNKSDFRILRYRDDYRIFVNNPNIADEIIKNLTEVLIELGLKLNSHKTFMSNDIIGASIKPDKLDWMSRGKKSISVQKQLLVLHQFSNKHPNSGTLEKELQNILVNINIMTRDKTIKKVLINFKYTIKKRVLTIEDYQYHFDKLCKINIKKKKNFIEKNNINVLISIVVNIAFHNPKAYTISIAIINKLFTLIEDKSVIEIAEKTIMKFQTIPNTGYMEIWLQRSIIKLDYQKLQLKEKMCRLVNGEDIKLWNNCWLQANIVEIFNKNKIVNHSSIQNTPEIIDINDISFSVYDGQ